MGGLLSHAKAFCAITNPLVNSYKRLVPGLRSADGHCLVRAKPQSAGARAGFARREYAHRAANARPVLQSVSRVGGDAAAGLDGVEREIDPGPPVNKNIYKMSHRERRHLRIDELPGNLSEALDELEKSDLMRDTLGRSHLRPVPDGQAGGVGRLHPSRVALGDRPLSETY